MFDRVHGVMSSIVSLSLCVSEIEGQPWYPWYLYEHAEGMENKRSGKNMSVRMMFPWEVLRFVCCAAEPNKQFY
jgi:hypothetical protein